ncbi:MAG: Nif11 family protein [Actinomycetota bacterium]
MSIEQAQALIRRLNDDEEFQQRFIDTPAEDRRALLEAEGYGDVRPPHLAHTLPKSAGGELTDDEFAAVAGAGGDTSLATALGTWTGSVAITAAVALSA